MKSPTKIFFAVFSAGAVAAMIAFGWSAKAKNDVTFHLANGMQVTPVETKPDDITAALDAHIWKFDVVLPDSSKMYNYSLLLCQHGKVVTSLGGVGIEPSSQAGEGSSHTQVTVGMVPINDTFSKAQRIKYNLHTSTGGTTGVFSNPFKASRRYTEDVQASESDNAIYLMSGTNSNRRSGVASENDTSIALKIDVLPSGLVKP